MKYNSAVNAVSLTLICAAIFVASLAYMAYIMFAGLSEAHKKEQEALLKAGSMQQEGVWPPAPTTYSEAEEPEIWAWCMKCQRASTIDSVSDSGGVCSYADCGADIGSMVAWGDLQTRTAGLPEQPESETVYPNLISVKAADTPN